MKEPSDIMHSYYDEILMLIEHCNETYEEPSSDLIKFDIDEFKRKQTYFIVSRVVTSILGDNPMRDPMEVLMNLEDRFSIQIITCKQSVNQNYFRYCSDLISELLKKLMESRGT